MLSRMRPVRLPDERGTTMLEVIVTASLSIVLLGSVLGLFDTFLRAESRFEGRIDENTDLQLAAAEFSRDTRSGSSPWPATTSAEMARVVTLPRADGTGSPEIVRWSIEADGTLERSEVQGKKLRNRRTVLDGISFDSSSLHYYAAGGAELVAGVDSADRIAACAARIELRLQDDSGAALTALAGATLRNAEPEPTC